MLYIDDLKESNEFLNNLLGDMLSAVLVLDMNACVKSYNDSFLSMFPGPENKIQGQPFGNALGCMYAVEEGETCGATSNCENCTLRNSLLNALTKKIPAYKERLTRKFYIRGRQITKYFLYTARYVHLKNEEMVLIIMDDITERIEAQLKLKKMQTADGLTQLYNHKHIYYKLEEEINRARRYGNALSLMLVDVDHFKEINDAFGHKTGDQTLAKVAQVIKSNLRGTDSAGRYGGEEFIIILPHTSLQNACVTAERIRKAMEFTKFQGVNRQVTVSIGVAGFLSDLPLELIYKAEEQLYKAKKNGRNRIEN